MAGDLVFVQSPCPQLYRGQCDGVVPTGPQVLYLLPQSASGPQQLDLASSWSGTSYSDGCYVFVDEPVPQGGETAFADAVWTYLAAPGRTGARLAWITNPNQSSAPYAGPFVGVTTHGPPYTTAGAATF